jgi:hypothetical protein
MTMRGNINYRNTIKVDVAAVEADAEEAEDVEEEVKMAKELVYLIINLLYSQVVAEEEEEAEDVEVRK